MKRSKKIRPVLFITGFVFGIAILFYAFIDEGSSKAHSDAEERKSLFMDDTYDQYLASRGTENRIAEDIINQKEKVTADSATGPVAIEPKTAIEPKMATEPKAAPDRDPVTPAEVKSETVSRSAQARTATAPEPEAAKDPELKVDMDPAPAAPAPETVDEADLLARLITAEAQGEPYEAQVAVGAVVINRVQSGVWANTIEAVIYQRINGYYQFTPVQNGWINKPAESESIKAAQAALSGVDPTNGAQFYYDDKTTNAWILAKPVSVKIGHMIYAF